MFGLHPKIKKLEDKIQNQLTEFNVVIDEVLSIQKDGNYDKLADIISSKLNGMVEEFINLNQVLKDNLEKV